MDAGGFGFLVAGSRREFIVVNVDESVKVKPPCLFYYLFFFFCWKLSFFRPLYKNEDTGVLRNSLVFAMWTILLPDWREICVFDALSLCTIVHLVSFTCN
jgi:hypothetical protein